MLNVDMPEGGRHLNCDVYALPLILKEYGIEVNYKICFQN